MNDENTGLGGSYTMNAKTGKRTLLARTAPAAASAAEQTDEPADAGFFSPAQPDDSTAKE